MARLSKLRKFLVSVDIGQKNALEISALKKKYPVRDQQKITEGHFFRA